MSWELGVGLVTVTSVYGLLKIQDLLGEGADTTHTAILSGFKIYLVVLALLIMMGGLLAVAPIINASIDSSQTVEVDKVKSIYETMYVGQMWLFIPFIMFLMVILIMTVFNFFKEKKAAKERGLLG